MIHEWAGGDQYKKQSTGDKYGTRTDNVISVVLIQIFIQSWKMRAARLLLLVSAWLRLRKYIPVVWGSWGLLALLYVLSSSCCAVARQLPLFVGVGRSKYSIHRRTPHPGRRSHASGSPNHHHNLESRSTLSLQPFFPTFPFFGCFLNTI